MRRFFLLLPLIAACDTAGTDTPTAERGGLGKADLVGSCALPNGKTLCGGKGKGNCWCDEACVDFGDCCGDADEVCGIEPPEPEGEPCGGIAGLACDDGELCQYAPEQMCGAADQLGECVVQPEVCIQLFAPVCGCDGQTYSNACFAAAAGTSVAHEGECAPAGKFCGGIAGFPCPDGQVCVDDPNDDCDPENGGADCGGVCVPAPEPEPCHVAGCSDELCVGPDGPDASICIAQDWYVCLELTQCGNFGDGGACGWEPNAEFTACMAAHGQG
jgi:hypothetical protein